jgi:branched-chain amino acid aminotransferase
VNRAFLYGDGFFEAFKVVKGVPLFWNYHWERIQRTISFLRFENSFSEDELKVQISNYLQEVSLENGRLRITFFRTGKGKYLPESNAYQIDFNSAELEGSRFELQRIEKLHLSLIQLPRHISGNFKLIAKPMQVLAALDAKENGVGEAVLLNDQNEVCEGISGNVFILKNNQLFTPPLVSGCLAGTMRALLLKEYPNTFEKTLSKDDLTSAEAIIFTNSTKGITVYSKFDSENTFQPLVDWLNEKMLSSIQDFQGN